MRDIVRKTALDIATDIGYTAITQLLKDRRKVANFFHFSYRNKYCFKER